MSRALSNIARIRGGLAEIEAGEVGEDARWLAARFRDYLETARLGAELDVAFGVERLSSVPPWWIEESTAQRDRLLEALAGHLAITLAPAARPSRIAKVIADRARRYESAAWSLDRANNGPPEGADRVRSLLFELRMSGAQWPLGWRTILKLIENSLQRTPVPAAKAAAAE